MVVIELMIELRTSIKFSLCLLTYLNLLRNICFVILVLLCPCWKEVSIELALDINIVVQDLPLLEIIVVDILAPRREVKYFYLWLHFSWLEPTMLAKNKWFLLHSFTICNAHVQLDTWLKFKVADWLTIVE